MANRTFQDYASSGELNQLRLGGVTELNDVILHGEHGLADYSLGTPVVLSLTTSFQKVGIFDTVVIDHTHDLFSYDEVNKRIVMASNGVVKLDVAASISGANNAEVTFAFYVNGLKATSLLDPIWICRGTTKPIGIITSQPFELAVDDYIEIWAKVDAATDITIQASSGTVQKKPY